MVWRRRNAARLSAAEDALLRRCIVRLPCTGSLWRSLEASNPVRTVPTSSAWHAARLLSANKLIALHFAVKLFEVDYFHEVKIKQTVYICITPYSECSLMLISRVLSVTHIINKSASILFGSQHWRWPMLSCVTGTGSRYLPPASGLRQSSCTSLLLTGYRSTGQTDGHCTVTRTLTARNGQHQ